MAEDGHSFPKDAEVEVEVEVTLRHDLSRYHPSLVPGAVGRTVPPEGAWRNVQNRHVRVKFEEVTLDVLWRNLEETDPRVRKELEAKWRKIEAQLGCRAATAERLEGPMGGLRGYHVQLKDGSLEVIRSRADCARLEKIVEKARVTVSTRRLPPKKGGRSLPPGEYHPRAGGGG